MRFKPLNGFKRSSFGAMAFVENNHPPTSKGAAKAAITTSVNHGIKVIAASNAAALRYDDIMPVSKAVSRLNEKLFLAMPDTRSLIKGPNTIKPIAPKTKTKVVPSSFDRGTWPSSRPFCNRRAVGSSVFS